MLFKLPTMMYIYAMISHARWCGTFQIQLTSHCMHFVRAADDDYYYYITLMMMAMAMAMGAMTMEAVTIQLQQMPMPVMTTRTIRERIQSLTTKTTTCFNTMRAKASQQPRSCRCPVLLSEC